MHARTAAPADTVGDDACVRRPSEDRPDAPAPAALRLPRCGACAKRKGGGACRTAARITSVGR
jgi:hypothetical protein